MTAAPRVPFFDPTPLLLRDRAELHAAAARVIDSGRYILGPEVAAFEREAGDALGVSETVAVSSGSDALWLALRSLDVGPGDEVLTTPFSFVATPEAILRVGASVRFVDLEPGRFQPTAEAYLAALGPRTRAVLAVHLFGEPAPVDVLAPALRERGVYLVEDAAQAFGGRLATRALGAFGDVGCFSFFPTKPLGGFGDGGLLCAPEPGRLERLRALRQHGRTVLGGFDQVGTNGRLDAIQAALLRVRLRWLTHDLESRQRLAERYLAHLAGSGVIQGAQRPPERAGVWAVFALRVAERERVQAALAADGIETAVYYPQSLDEHAPYATKHALPEARRAAATALALPLHAGLTLEQVDTVAEALLRHCR